jgi:hypothetical protein
MRLARSAIVLACVLAGCAAQEIANQESLLAAAGFRAVPADTPTRAAIMASLPPGQLALVWRNGKPAWFYADPEGCRCLYVGGQHAHQAYERLAVRQRIAETQLQAAQMNQLAWGPWPSGPFGPYDPWAYWFFGKPS